MIEKIKNWLADNTEPKSTNGALLIANEWAKESSLQEVLTGLSKIDKNLAGRWVDEVGIPASCYYIMEQAGTGNSEMLELLVENEELEDKMLEKLASKGWKDSEVAQEVLNARQSESLTPRQEALRELLTSYEGSTRSRKREILERLDTFLDKEIEELKSLGVAIPECERLMKYRANRAEEEAEAEAERKREAEVAQKVAAIKQKYQQVLSANSDSPVYARLNAAYTRCSNELVELGLSKDKVKVELGEPPEPPAPKPEPTPEAESEAEETEANKATTRDEEPEPESAPEGGTPVSRPDRVQEEPTTPGSSALPWTLVVVLGAVVVAMWLLKPEMETPVAQEAPETVTTSAPEPTSVSGQTTRPTIAGRTLSDLDLYVVTRGDKGSAFALVSLVFAEWGSNHPVSRGDLLSLTRWIESEEGKEIREKFSATPEVVKARKLELLANNGVRGVEPDGSLALFNEQDRPVLESHLRNLGF